MLVNDVSLRNLIPAELGKGLRLLPVEAVERLLAGRGRRRTNWATRGTTARCMPLVSHLNGELFGRRDAGVDMTFDFRTLIAHAAKTRPLVAGTIVGSGTVSNEEGGGPGRPVGEGGVGYSCIAEQRTVETLQAGKATTPFLRFGDRVRIEMHDRNGHSIFGAIDQQVRPPA